MNKTEEMEKLIEKMKNCKLCKLWKSRKKVVPGEGNLNSFLMLIGLGPGYWENEKGRPFVGAAGKLLDKLLRLAKLDRKEVYITNVIKCYLPDNKASKEEIETCTSNFLDKQIELIKPKIITTLGSVAFEYIAKKFGLKLGKLSEIHGKLFETKTLFSSVKIIPTFHPASALYNPNLRNVLEADWRKIKDLIYSSLHTKNA